VLPAYVVCPLCGRNRVITPERKGLIRWDYVDLHSSPIIQIRETTGKTSGPSLREGKGRAPGSGFPLVESKTLTEILEDPQYRETLEGLRTQLLRLIKDGVELGLLKETLA
jgi:hypothetical protein